MGDEPDDLDPLWQDSRRPDTLCEWVRNRGEPEPLLLPPRESAAAEEGRGRGAHNDGALRHLGAIEVAHYGCGIVALLVVSGPERGAIWVDDPN